MQGMLDARSLTHAFAVITRPAGTGGTLAAALRRCGVTPLSLPTVSLRNVTDVVAARAALQRGLRADMAIFTSPAAVRFAQGIQRLRSARSRKIIAVGATTVAALRRNGVDARAPSRQDSEGVLALDALQSIVGQEVAVIGAPGGRGLLQRTLLERGARVQDVHVYQRVAARLDRRHLHALQSVAGPLFVLVSSERTLAALRARLPSWAWEQVRDATIVASSARVQRAAMGAGCRSIVRARSATDADLVAAVARI